MLDADEYVAFRHLCEEAGISQSAMARMLIKEAVRREALRIHALSAKGDDPATDDDGQD